jgi:hypothetical protein
MRALFGVGTPREAAAASNAFVFVIQAAEAIVVVVLAACDAQIAALVINVGPDAAQSNRDFFIGLLRYASRCVCAPPRCHDTPCVR